MHIDLHLKKYRRKSWLKFRSSCCHGGMNGYGTKKSSNECDADMTLLMHASYGGYLESVKVLVKNRADVNVKSKLGATALKLA